MAETDTLAARREARRRRILENSEHRLKKITGVSKTEGGDDDSAPVIHSVQQFVSPQNVKKDVTPDVHSGLPGEEWLTSGREKRPSSTDIRHDSSPKFSVLQSSTNDEDMKLTESSSVMQPDESEEITRENILQQEVEPVLKTLHSARLHLVVLAAVVRLLLSMNYGFLFAESAFVPFFSLECAEYAMERHSLGGGSKSSMLGAALLLSGIAPQRVAVMNRALRTLQRCMLDFNLYFFAFIVVHVFVEILQ